MEVDTQTITAGILRAGLVIGGFVWGVIIVQNPENGIYGKLCGILLMILFAIIWLAVAFKDLN